MKNLIGIFKIGSRSPFQQAMAMMVVLLLSVALIGPGHAFAGMDDEDATAPRAKEHLVESSNDSDKTVFDGFESKNFSGGDGWLSKWTRKGNVRLVKNNPFEGKRYVYITGGSTPGYLERAVDLSNFSAARLKFRSRGTFSHDDVAYIKVSPDGVNYTTVAEITHGALTPHYYDVWTRENIDLSAFTMSDDFRIVFEGAMSSKTKDSWALDNIEIIDGGSGETFNLDADVLGKGRVDMWPRSGVHLYDGVYLNGAKVWLDADQIGNTPGWVFDHWEGDATGTAMITSLIMDHDKTATAVFIETDTYRMNVTSIGQGSVTTYPVSHYDGFRTYHPSWIPYAYGGGVFTEGTSVELEATPPRLGWVFDHWEGDVTGTTNPVTVVMDNDITVTAVFLKR